MSLGSVLVSSDCSLREIVLATGLATSFEARYLVALALKADAIVLRYRNKTVPRKGERDRGLEATWDTSAMACALTVLRMRPDFISHASCKMPILPSGYSYD